MCDVYDLLSFLQLLVGKTVHFLMLQKQVSVFETTTVQVTFPPLFHSSKQKVNTRSVLNLFNKFIKLSMLRCQESFAPADKGK